jgi:hypothetical protein
VDTDGTLIDGQVRTGFAAWTHMTGV